MAPSALCTFFSEIYFQVQFPSLRTPSRFPLSLYLSFSICLLLSSDLARFSAQYFSLYNSKTEILFSQALFTFFVPLDSLSCVFSFLNYVHNRYSFQHVLKMLIH